MFPLAFGREKTAIFYPRGLEIWVSGCAIIVGALAREQEELQTGFLQICESPVLHRGEASCSALQMGSASIAPGTFTCVTFITLGTS